MLHQQANSRPQKPYLISLKWPHLRHLTNQRTRRRWGVAHKSSCQQQQCAGIHWHVNSLCLCILLKTTWQITILEMTKTSALSLTGVAKSLITEAIKKFGTKLNKTLIFEIISFHWMTWTHFHQGTNFSCWNIHNSEECESRKEAEV